MEQGEKRQICWGMADQLMAEYHDNEWGVPCRDDAQLFERLMLEGFQAGLSWSTILNKRENFRRAFDGWDVITVAAYDDEKIEQLLADPGIVRNRLKVTGAVKNARVYLATQDEFGSFATYAWSFVNGTTLAKPAPVTFNDVPAKTDISDAMSRALQRRGFTFVGSTICYAFMQSVGMVNDHLADCPAREPRQLGLLP